MSKPNVSVILTSYNHGEWLRQSIESVFAQTYGDWELIVLENGSTDHSPMIVDEYRAHPNVQVVRYPSNQPHSKICNAGVTMASGRYVSFLYSDDYYLPRKLERQVAAFERLSEQYGVVYSGGYRLFSDGQLRDVPCGSYRGDVLEALLTQPQFFPPIAPMARRECFVRFPFNERVFGEGEAIFSRIALRYWFEALPEPLVVMRDHERNVGKEIRQNLERNSRIYEELFSRPEFPAQLRFLRGVAFGGIYRIAGLEAIRRERDHRQGHVWLKMAVKYNPKLLADLRVVGGLVLSSLPASLARRCDRLLDRLRGVPVPPVRGPLTPVVGDGLEASADASLRADQGHG